MAIDTQTKGDVTDQAHEHISSRLVEGTPVYDRDGEKLGTVHSVMIGKRSGRVSYALISFGGFFSLGANQVHPVPWSVLDYEEDKDGYVVNFSRDDLAKAPSYELDADFRPREAGEMRSVFDYYGVITPFGF